MEFMRELISYISSAFSADTDISDSVSVVEAYRNAKQRIPEITVQILSDGEEIRYNTFEGETTSKISVQVTAFTEQMAIGGIVKSAQDASLIFADKIKAIFQKAKVIGTIPSVLGVRRIGGQIALPQDKGTKVYMSPVRFEFLTINKGE